MLPVNGRDQHSPLKCNAPQEVESPMDHHPLNVSPRLSFQFYYSSAELLNEIITVEDEIAYLERYLLSLYREAFNQTSHSFSEKCETEIQNKILIEPNIITDQSCSNQSYFFKDVPVHHHGISSVCASTDSDDWNRVGMLKPSTQRDRVVVEHGHRSLADYLVASRIDNNLNRPDRLSEDIIRCISSIYIKLADPAGSQKGLSASSVSSFSSSGAFSPRSDSWSPHFSEEARDRQIQELNEKSDPHAAMFEVLKLSLDDDSFNYAARVLQNFRLLINNLEKVDTTKMMHEEKLTFWINIHNALVMHAHLAYGTSNHVKSASILKAAYNVSGHCINADIIQSSILGVRSHLSAPQWLDTLLSPGKKFKPARTRHKFSIDHAEPLVHFALSSGVYSDPAVRVYTANTISEDLKIAQKEFIQASVYINKEKKICLPKILDYFAKDMSLTMQALLEIVYARLPEFQQKSMLRCIRGRPDKFISWLPQSSTFRYVIDREVSRKR
ncbi:Ternary complex factor MIP1, leucine-zipper [Heracleum sosnowskyi]|uniref:Ternary complex factor MIP1, leucine-zipper n=1 Tax=Heracleum sosnowskyi TaxID=360622 RepID=A0AAD8NDE5_9APIA|nr:Ternary complex factor MIP1, leucine-zipper [Heracleum sosnowskyi]